MLSYTLEGELREDEQIGGVAGHSPGEFAFVTDAVCDDRRVLSTSENTMLRIAFRSSIPMGILSLSGAATGSSPDSFFGHRAWSSATMFCGSPMPAIIAFNDLTFAKKPRG